MIWRENVSLKTERRVSLENVLETENFLNGFIESLLLTEPLGSAKNLQVTDPTVNSLRVRWEPADGDVRQYNVLYVPVAGGAEGKVTSGVSVNYKCFVLLS